MFVSGRTSRKALKGHAEYGIIVSAESASSKLSRTANFSLVVQNCALMINVSPLNSYVTFHMGIAQQLFIVHKYRTSILAEYSPNFALRMYIDALDCYIPQMSDTFDICSDPWDFWGHLLCRNSKGNQTWNEILKQVMQRYVHTKNTTRRFDLICAVL